MNNERQTMNADYKIQRIKEIAAELLAMFDGHHVQISTSPHHCALTYHGTKTYSDATQWFRELGVQVRQKRVYDTYTAVSGVRDGVEFQTFPDELPPTCRKVTVTEKVPKQETRDTGDFIEVTRTIIQCGEKCVGFGGELDEPVVAGAGQEA